LWGSFERDCTHDDPDCEKISGEKTRIFQASPTLRLRECFHDKTKFTFTDHKVSFAHEIRGKRQSLEKNHE
jgi:hypothetical protein